jgi:hypothetical protein
MGFGPVWTPTRYFSVAANVGVARTDFRMKTVTGEDPGSTNFDPQGGVELRLDYPFRDAWMVGLRAGLLLINSSVKINLPSNPWYDYKPGTIVMYPISAAVSYGF